MMKFEFQATNEDNTQQFGAALAAALPPGTVVALVGTLGAGKTRLVQAIAAASGVAREDVVSPTFVLCHEYHGTRTINHIDAYRLKDEDEFRNLGGDEILASDAITCIEWADRITAALPEDYVEIEVTVEGPTSRRFIARSVGKVHKNTLAALAQRMAVR